MSSEEKTLTLELPDGQKLVVAEVGDTDYPGLGIFLNSADMGKNLLCFVEYNPHKPEGLEICVGAYTESEDDIIYYASYKQKEPYEKP